MDQEAWNQIYNALDGDVAGAVTRGGGDPGLEIAVLMDRIRFAIDADDNGAAIALIDELKARLADTRRGGPAPTVERLVNLEDRLHAESRLGSARLEIVGEEEEAPTRSSSRNTKVNKSIKYDDIAAELVTMFNVRENPRRKEQCRCKARPTASIANRKIYEEIEADTKVPWYFTGVIHGMECSFSLAKHLHNGDSLKGRTWQVPAGRPKDGAPPFDFEDSAVDALSYDGFAGKTDWQLAMILFRLERYNGFGYRKKFGTASPYLWSYSSHFTAGKYVKDGVYDPDAPSKQCGAAVMLLELQRRGVISFEPKKPEPVAAPAPIVVAPPPAAPAPTPTPPAQPDRPPHGLPPSPVQAATPAPAPAAPHPAPVAARTSTGHSRARPAGHLRPPVRQFLPPVGAGACTRSAPVTASAPAVAPPPAVPTPRSRPGGTAGRSHAGKSLSPAVAQALAALAAAAKPEDATPAAVKVDGDKPKS